MLESGVIDKLHQDTMKYEPRKAEITVQSMELVDVVPIFSISTAGIFVAIFLIFLEHLFAWRLHRKHQNNVPTNQSFVEA
jgi:hypothetical protein